MKIMLKDICFSYPSHDVLDEVTMEVAEGEILSIVGPNGSGKSTLLKCMARILKPKNGAVFLDGKQAAKINTLALAKILGYVPQASADVFQATVLETILMGRKPHLKWGVSSNDIDIIARAIQFTGIADLAERRLDQLSGGQKQKVFIARVLAQEPEIFLFDEPTSSLDIRHQLEVLETVRQLVKHSKRTVIMVLHDLNLASRFSDKIVMLKNGRIFASGDPEAIITEENISSVFGVVASVVESTCGPYVIPLRPVGEPVEVAK